MDLKYGRGALGAKVSKAAAFLMTSLLLITPFAPAMADGPAPAPSPFEIKSQAAVLGAKLDPRIKMPTAAAPVAPPGPATTSDASHTSSSGQTSPPPEAPSTPSSSGDIGDQRLVYAQDQAKNNLNASMSGNTGALQFAYPLSFPAGRKGQKRRS